MRQLPKTNIENEGFIKDQDLNIHIWSQIYHINLPLICSIGDDKFSQ